MRERLYLAGCPTTPSGWVGFGLVMLVGAVGTYLFSGALLFALVLITWPLHILAARWSLQNRLVCYLTLWVLLYRVHGPDLPWYRVLPVAALVAAAVAWVQEQRRLDAGPVG